MCAVKHGLPRLLRRRLAAVCPLWRPGGGVMHARSVVHLALVYSGTLWRANHACAPELRTQHPRVWAFFEGFEFQHRTIFFSNILPLGQVGRWTGGSPTPSLPPDGGGEILGPKGCPKKICVGGSLNPFPRPPAHPSLMCCPCRLRTINGGIPRGSPAVTRKCRPPCRPLWGTRWSGVICRASASKGTCMTQVCGAQGSGQGGTVGLEEQPRAKWDLRAVLAPDTTSGRLWRVQRPPEHSASVADDCWRDPMVVGGDGLQLRGP